jgi:energy-coupling factor transporter ATP-binding protein EcfA2
VTARYGAAAPNRPRVARRGAEAWHTGGVKHVWIRRIVVEEGFLDGLDLTFEPGLNVLIGPRGVGKTSVIQLLRFGLGLHAYGEQFDAAAARHAQQILGEDGRVSVLLMVDNEEVAVSRRRDDPSPEGLSDGLPLPIVLAQTEIEEVATDPAGRLRLLDGFRSGVSRAAAHEQALRSTLSSLTIELRDLDTQLVATSESIARLQAEIGQLREGQLEVTTPEGAPDRIAEAMAQLDALGKSLAISHAKIALLEAAAEQSLTPWAQSIEKTLRSVPHLERWPDETSDAMGEARIRVAEVSQALSTAVERLGAAARHLGEDAEQRRVRVRTLEDEARGLRRTVDEMQAGAGTVARKLAVLREREAQLAARQSALEEQRARSASSRIARDLALTELGEFRDAQFESRREVAAQLNAALGPRIKIAVERSGLWDSYANAIAESLRGSGLHYSELAPEMARRLSPEELLRVVEENDAARVAAAAQVPADRASRVVDRLREAGLTRILEAPIQDAITLRLLDGVDYKTTNHLSTGQRCTTVLPIVMRHEERTVVLDQPEDHLDGGFIVDTFIRAVLERGSAQMIATTHNANVPVLGEASSVTLLNSDGRRGYVEHSGRLDEPATVEAITTVMEGGLEAFRRRASFYRAG